MGYPHGDNSQNYDKAASSMSLVTKLFVWGFVFSHRFQLFIYSLVWKQSSAVMDLLQIRLIYLCWEASGGNCWYVFPFSFSFNTLNFGG